MRTGVGLEWVCGIGETWEVRISIQYKIAPTSLSICPLDHMRRPRIRLTQDDVVVAASTSLERSCQFYCVKTSRLCASRRLTSPHQHCLGDAVSRHQSRRSAKTRQISWHVKFPPSTADTPVAPENTCSLLRSTMAFAKVFLITTLCHDISEKC
jgi:hypothetical protein